MKKTIAMLLALFLLMPAMAVCGESSDGRADAGSVSAVCPDGWTHVPLREGGFEDGELVTTALELRKGDPSMAFWADSAPRIFIEYGESTSLLMGVSMASFLFDEPEAVGPMQIGDRTWEGVTGGWNGDTLVILTSDDGDDLLIVTLFLDFTVGDLTISLDDADVQEIIASIQHN